MTTAVKPITLYDITDAYHVLMDLDAGTGELAEFLERTEGDFDLKVQNTVAVILNLEASARTLDTEASRLKQKATEMSDRARWLRERTCEGMRLMGKENYDFFTLARTVKVQESPPSVEAPDPEKVPEEFVKRAGFAMMATLAVHDKDASDGSFVKFYPAIKRGATDERNFVKKAVNWALRQIGKRNKRLNRSAIKAAKEIAKIDSRAARWIAANALRELQSEAVQRRLEA